jgi:hypothetical protein
MKTIISSQAALVMAVGASAAGNPRQCIKQGAEHSKETADSPTAVIPHLGCDYHHALRCC